MATVFAEMLEDFKLTEKVSLVLLTLHVWDKQLRVQILSVTCDNASNNDAMIEELQELIPEFAGSASHTRCFLHIVNLVAKSLIRQLDAKKTVVGDHELAELQKELDEEELIRQSETVDANDDEMPEEDENDDEMLEKKDDNDEGWVDETEDMSNEEKNELEKSIRPVKLALVKVSMRYPTSLHTVESIPFLSSARSPSESSTRRPKSSRPGKKSWPIFASRSV